MFATKNYIFQILIQEHLYDITKLFIQCMLVYKQNTNTYMLIHNQKLVFILQGECMQYYFAFQYIVFKNNLSYHDNLDFLHL